jgi:triosephosphate isomerase
VGHSERRHIYGEVDNLLIKKTKHALAQNLNVVFCIGELLADRESGNTEKVVQSQLNGLKSLNESQWNNIVLAYEPVWAIGTGVVATPEQAQDTHKFIRKWVAKNVSESVARNIRIIYGGSVSDGNCGDLIKRDDIDGFLIGGVALKPAFKTVVEISEQWLKE